MIADRWRQRTPKADGSFVNAPNWNWNDDKLNFDTYDVANCNDNYGSASAVLSVSEQCLPTLSITETTRLAYAAG